jgi:hypothetical protein
MIDAHSMTIQKLIVSVRLPDDDSENDVPWPYEHIPRVGEKFSFEAAGPFYIVREVQYNFVDGGAFHAVVMLGGAADGSHVR